MSEFDAEKSRSERDIGIARVLGANATFAAVAGLFIINLPRGWEGTGEDIRRVYFRSNTLKPKHHNAWGGVINSAVRSGVLVKTGKRKGMIASRSHSRTTDVYERV